MIIAELYDGMNNFGHNIANLIKKELLK